MNTTRYNSLRDFFPVLDLDACFRFKTQSSISFRLGRFDKHRSVFTSQGWLDVHHPVMRDGYTSVFLRVFLPAEYLTLDQMKQMIEAVLAALEIPENEVSDAYFVTAEGQTAIGTKGPDGIYL